MARSVVGSQFSRKKSTLSGWISLVRWRVSRPARMPSGIGIVVAVGRLTQGATAAEVAQDRLGKTQRRRKLDWRLGSSLDSQAVLAHGTRLGCGQAAYDAVFRGLSLMSTRPVKPTDNNACARVASDVGTRGDQSGSGAPAVGSRSLRPVKKRRTSAAVFDCDVSDRTREE